MKRGISTIAASGTYEEMHAHLNRCPLTRIDRFNKTGDTPAGVASQFGNLGTLTALWEKGADLDLCDLDRGGEPPLHAALVQGHVEVIEFLLNRGVSLEAPGWMALDGHYRLRKFIEQHPDALPDTCYAGKLRPETGRQKA